MITRRILLSSLALLPALQPQTAIAQQTRRGGNSAFSFAVYGDSRSMMYLPYTRFVIARESGRSSNHQPFK